MHKCVCKLYHVRSVISSYLFTDRSIWNCRNRMSTFLLHNCYLIMMILKNWKSKSWNPNKIVRVWYSVQKDHISVNSEDAISHMFVIWVKDICRGITNFLQLIMNIAMRIDSINKHLQTHLRSPRRADTAPKLCSSASPSSVLHLLPKPEKGRQWKNYNPLIYRHIL